MAKANKMPFWGAFKRAVETERGLGKRVHWPLTFAGSSIEVPVSQRFVFPRVICSPEHWALVLCVPPPHPIKQFSAMCSLQAERF